MDKSMTSGSGWSSGAARTGGGATTPSSTASASLGSPLKSSKLGLMSINEDKLNLASAPKKAQQLPGYASKMSATRATYVPMSAKARGDKSCHPGKVAQAAAGAEAALEGEGDLPKGLKSLAKPAPKGGDKSGTQKPRKADRYARDTTEWIKQDRQYAPYSNIDSMGPGATNTWKKSSPPPVLWLPGDPIAYRSLKSGDGLPCDVSMPLGAEAGEDGDEEASRPPPGADLVDRPAWDSEHHIMVSRLNHEMQTGTREYFDAPKRKDGVGVPKVREQYVAHDRQCCWQDEPAPFGENRHTIWDNIAEPRAHQLPSYWRKVGDWGSFSSPDLHLSVTKKGMPKTRPEPKPFPGMGRKAMLEALADLPADQATAFWRGWADGKQPKGTMPAPSRWDQPKGWDSRWNVTAGAFNTQLKACSREYFEVPRGALGKSMQAPRPRGGHTQHMAQTQGASEPVQRS